MIWSPAFRNRSWTEGVQSVKREAEYEMLGLPTPGKDPQAPDVLIFAKSGYAFTGGKEGDPVIGSVEHPGGSHGYINTDPDLDAIFIASGYGVRPHVELDEIQNLSVAPTLARLFGIQLSRTEASALNEILQ